MLAQQAPRRQQHSARGAALECTAQSGSHPAARRPHLQAEPLQRAQRRQPRQQVQVGAVRAGPQACAVEQQRAQAQQAGQWRNQRLQQQHTVELQGGQGCPASLAGVPPAAAVAVGARAAAGITAGGAGAGPGRRPGTRSGRRAALGAAPRLRRRRQPAGRRVQLQVARRGVQLDGPQVPQAPQRGAAAHGAQLAGERQAAQLPQPRQLPGPVAVVRHVARQCRRSCSSSCAAPAAPRLQQLPAAALGPCRAAGPGLLLLLVV
jgi:hypothetical protein